MTNVNLDELERYATDWQILSDERGRCSGAILALIARIRKLEAVAKAAEKHCAWMEAETKPGRSFFPELKAALAALDAKEDP